MGNPPAGTCIFPTMTGSPDIDAGGQPVQGATSIVSVPASPNADSATVYFYDWPLESHVYGRGTGYSDGGTSVQVPVEMTCLASASSLIFGGNVLDTPDNLETEYYYDSSIDAGVYQFANVDFGHNDSQGYGQSTIPLAKVNETADPTCVFPALTGPPVFASATADAGQPLVVSVPVSSAVRHVQVDLFTFQYSTLAGYGFYPPDGGVYDGGTPDGAVEVTIPVPASAQKVTYYPYVYVYGKSNSYTSTYLRYTADAGTYVFQQYDPIYLYGSGSSSTYLDAGIPIPLVTVQ
jgi:hypothetical protein